MYHIPCYFVRIIYGETSVSVDLSMLWKFVKGLDSIYSSLTKNAKKFYYESGCLLQSQMRAAQSVTLCFVLFNRLSPQRPKQSHFSSSALLHIQAGERDQSFMLNCLSFMCVVSFDAQPDAHSLSLLCFRSSPGAKTVELLCLPTDISKLALLCLGRLLQ